MLERFFKLNISLETSAHILKLYASVLCSVMLAVHKKTGFLYCLFIYEYAITIFFIILSITN